MAERKTKLGKIQIEWSHSSTLLKVLVIVLIVFSMVALAALSWVRMSILAQTEEMRAKAAELEERTQKLEERMEEIDSVQTIRDIAREELGLADPNSVMIQPQ